MADTTTTAYGLTKPEVGASEDTWGTKINTDFDSLDTIINAIGGKTAAGTLSYADSAKLATTSTGVDVTGNLTAGYLAVGTTSDSYSQILINSSTTGESELRMGDTDTDAGSVSYTNSNDTMTFRAAAGARMALNSTGLDITGTLTSDGLTVDNDGSSALLSIQAGVPGSVSGDPKLEFIGATSASGVAGYANIYMDVPSGGKSDMYFQTAASGGSGGQANRMKIHGTGDISFYEDTGTTPKFFWDASAEKLGLGNTSPTSSLHITSGNNSQLTVEGNDTNPTTIMIDYNSTGSTDRVRIQNDAGDMKFATSNGQVRQTITKAGNVGIGTDSPTAPLTVDNTTNNQIKLRRTASGNNVLAATFSDTGSTGETYVAIGSDGDDLVMRSGGAEAMRIDSSGNVGIGLTNPSYYSGKLTVDGGNIAIAGGNRALFWNSAGSGVASIQGVGTNELSFSTSNSYTEAMRIDSSGFIDMGPQSLSGVGRLNVSANPSNNYLAQWWNTSGVTVGHIVVSGGGTATTYATSSDYRLKTDAQPMTGATDRLKQLNPVNFEWLSDGTRVDGFLAHEAQAVVPEAVTGAKDAMRDEEYEVTPAVLDDDGNVVTEAVMGTRSVPDMQGIDQSKLVPLLTAALQEALTKIDDLETRLTALEG